MNRLTHTRWVRAAVITCAAILTTCGGGDGPVSTPSVTRIDVTAAAQTIAALQTVQLTAVARGSDNAVIASASVAWSSSAANIATVSATGVVTGVAAGTAVISARAQSVVGSLPITVTSGAGVLARVVASTIDSPLELGQATQASVEGRDSQGGIVALGSRAVTWSSSNPAIATINSNGIVAGVGVGSTTLSVSVQDGGTARTATVVLPIIGIANAPLVADVAMAPQLFIPSDIAIKLGGTVRFQFTPIDHNVIWSPRLAGSPSDILVTTNALVARTFGTVGVYPFDCTVHPGMSGRVIVSP